MLKYRTCRGNEIQNVMMGMRKRIAFSDARIQRNWYIFKKKLTDNLGNIALDVLRDFFNGNVVFITTKRIFNFFSNKFQTSQDIKNENGKRNDIVSKRGAEYPRKCNNVEQDEFS